MDNFILFDGGMGTELQKRGMKAGSLPELLNITDPELIKAIHRDYVLAGADIITANTFGANVKKLGSREKVEEVILAGIKNAREAGAKKVALDIGPTGALLKPLGAMTFDEAYSLFKDIVLAGVKAGADLAIIETMSDLLEAKAALLAVKENSSLPVYVTLTFASDGRTFLGTDPKTAAITLSALGADAVGLNCSLGPKELLPLCKEFVKWASCPVIVQPNAGLPEMENGKTVYRVGPEEFATEMGKILDSGVTIAGGCCGTTPAHIKALRKEIDARTPLVRTIPHFTAFTSHRKSVVLGENDIAVIGERINPTGKKRIKEALRARNYDYIINEAIDQLEAGADILDVNAGLPEIDEKAVLEDLVGEIQAVCDLPLQIDSTDINAVERACRVYSGKPIINSVNGTEESLSSVLPIAKKYGAAVVALTLDENGIPETAEARYEIAEKIYRRCEKLGIPKEDIIVDCLVMTVSTNQSLARETLKAVRLVKEKLGLRTVLGVSNISFGLPSREVINSAFLAEAFANGLDLAIINPMSAKYMDIVSAHRVLSCEDERSEAFIEKYAANPEQKAKPVETQSTEYDITDIVLSGRKLLIEDAVRNALKSESAMDVINLRLIPAINAAGEKFDKGEFFLPQLMSSAETVKLGFEVIRSQASSDEVMDKGTIILATVKGDIHDIGKNIVKMLLQNYGYNVIDLGRDVPPELVAEEAKRTGAKLVGLSALMTTTVKGMEETVKALRAADCACKIMVGGAVLTKEYADMVGADYYAKDAAESARIAEKIFAE